MAGEFVLLYPLRVRDFGSIETYLLSKRLEILDHVSDRKRLKSVNHVTAEEIEDWLYTIEGHCFSLWLMLRGTKTLPQVEKFIEGSSSDDLMSLARLRSFLSGTDLLASADWPKLPEEFKSDEDSGGGNDVSWRLYIRQIIEYLYPGLTLEEVGNWTLYQLKMMACPEKELKGKLTLSASQLRKLSGRRK